MTVPTTAGDRVRRRWREWLETAGPGITPEQPLAAHERRGEVETGDAVPQLFVRELFARADLDERRALDLLLVALLEYRTQDARLVVRGPEDIRGRSTASVSGLTAAEFSLGPVRDGLRSVSLALVRVTRTARSGDVAASLESLARLLDYEHDPEGSEAVAHAIVRRLEVLTAGPGVTVSVAGVVNRPGGGRAVDAVHLLAGVALAMGDEVELRDGRLSVVSATATSVVAVPPSGSGEMASTDPVPRRSSGASTVGRARRPWNDGDYVLLRVGRPAARRAETARPLAQRRMEHALTEVGPTVETVPDGDSYSTRAASTRQAARAQQIVGQALDGDVKGAVALLRTALTQPGAQGPLVESVAAGVVGVPQFWTVRQVVEQAAAASDGATAPIAGLLADRLVNRLDDLLDLTRNVNSEAMIPVVTPIVLEVGDALVPIVDSKQDQGVFLYTLIPAMRDRVHDTSGVFIPGVRARGNPGLAPDGFAIQIDEVEVADGVAQLGYRYVVQPLDDLPPGADTAADLEITALHPVTGDPGRWGLTTRPDDEADPAAASCAQYIVHRLEREVRRHLSRFVGLQEVETLVDEWRAEDGPAVPAWIDTTRDRERLTVLLQELVAEEVPIVGWRDVLAAVDEAGGMGTDLRVLVQAVRRRLRHALPGVRSGPGLRPVPGSLQAVLHTGDGRVDGEARLGFLSWLRRTVGEVGPVLSLVVDDPRTRFAVAALTRTERAVVRTFTTEEVAGP